MSYPAFNAVRVSRSLVIYRSFLFVLIFLMQTEISASSIRATCETLPEVGFKPFNTPQLSKYSPGSWNHITDLAHIKYGSSVNPAKIWGSNNRTTSWMCGYNFSVHIPETFNASDYAYPLIVFLHGGLTTHEQHLRYLGKAFYVPEDDPYILAMPKKQEWDWNPNKLKDVIKLVASKIKIDPQRIYLTGLSMGGRGTFIVAASFPNLFAALMPLSPHHAPYSYVPLAPQIAHLPIWISHGDADRVSNFDSAKKMFQSLKNAGGPVRFSAISGGTHCCWEKIYGNKTTMEWLLSQQNNRSTVVKTTTWGSIKSQNNMVGKNNKN